MLFSNTLSYLPVGHVVGLNLLSPVVGWAMGLALVNESEETVAHVIFLDRGTEFPVYILPNLSFPEAE